MEPAAFIPSTRERRAFEPMFRAALHGTRQGLVGGVLLVLLLCWLFRGEAGGPAFWAWIAAFAVLAAIRAFLLAAWARWPDAALGRRQVVATVLQFALVGTLWGLVGFALPLASSHWAPYVVLASQLTLVVMAVPGLSWYWPCFVAFALPLQMLLPLPWISIDPEVAWVVAVGGLYNLVALSSFAARHARIQLTSIRLRDERQAMLRELEDKTRALARSVAAKSRFQAAAGHDLRQPLQAIALLVDRARQEGAQALGPPELEALARMVTDADEMLESLVEAARVDDPDGSWHRQPCDVQAVIDAVAEEQAGAATARQLLLRVHRGGDGALSHPVALRRILRNLLSNAVKYTERGGVLLALRRRDGQVWVEVWDTGPGIAETDRARIFAAYERLPGRDATSGLGLGLAVVRQLCEALGHSVEIASRPGRGSVFRVGLGHPVQLAGEGSRHRALVPSPAKVALFVRDDRLAAQVGGLLQRWNLDWSRFNDSAHWLEQGAGWAAGVPLVEAGAAPAEELGRLSAAFAQAGVRSVWLGGTSGRTASLSGWPQQQVELPLPLEPVRLRAVLNRLLALQPPTAGAPARSPETASSP